MITSLFDLDRAVKEASARLARARAALASVTGDDAPANPLASFRGILGKETYEEIATVPEPLLVPPLRAHVARLTLARVLWDDEVRIARAFGEPAVLLEDNLRLPRLPQGAAAIAASGAVAPKTLLFAVLIDPDDTRRRQVAHALARAARERLRDPVRLHADRRARAAAQLGVSLDALELPAPAPLLAAAAADLLTSTQPFAERFAPWDRGFARTVVHGASSGWPAHLAPRWVLSIFERIDLLRGTPIDHVRLPPILGASSFARALQSFGEAFGEAAAPRGAPFSLLRPALDLRPFRLGALFAMLVADRTFARSTLGLGPGAAIDHARTFAGAEVARLRLASAALRTRTSLFPPRDDLDDRFREETTRAWGEPLPPELAGAVPRITSATPSRFAATLLAALDRKHLIETLDEDWHKNPRAAEALRALAAEPEPALTEALLREGVVELARSLAERLT